MISDDEEGAKQDDTVRLSNVFRIDQQSDWQHCCLHVWSRRHKKKLLKKKNPGEGMTNPKPASFIKPLRYTSGKRVLVSNPPLQSKNR